MPRRVRESPAITAAISAACRAVPSFPWSGAGSHSSRLSDQNLLSALDASFRKKPALVEKNRLLMKEAESWLEKNLGL